MPIDEIFGARFRAVFEGQHIRELNPEPVVEGVGQEDVELQVGNQWLVDLET